MDCRNFITNLSKVAAGLPFLCFLPTLQAAGREKVNFSDGWRFALVNDAGMESSDYQEGAGLPAVRWWPASRLRTREVRSLKAGHESGNADFFLRTTVD